MVLYTSRGRTKKTAADVSHNDTMIALVFFVLTGNLICNFPQTGEISNFPCNMANF